MNRMDKVCIYTLATLGVIATSYVVVDSLIKLITMFGGK